MRRCNFCCSSRRSRFPGLHCSAAACIYTHSHLPHIRSDVIFASEASSAKQSKRLAHLATWTSIGYGSFIPHLFACIFLPSSTPRQLQSPNVLRKKLLRCSPGLSSRTQFPAAACLSGRRAPRIQTGRKGQAPGLEHERADFAVTYTLSTCRCPGCPDAEAASAAGVGAALPSPPFQVPRGWPSCGSAVGREEETPSKPPLDAYVRASCQDA